MLWHLQTMCSSCETCCITTMLQKTIGLLNSLPSMLVALRLSWTSMAKHFQVKVFLHNVFYSFALLNVINMFMDSPEVLFDSGIGCWHALFLGISCKSTVKVNDEPSTCTHKKAVKSRKDVMPNKTCWKQLFNETIEAKVIALWR